jgi:tight adherence protein B
LTATLIALVVILLSVLVLAAVLLQQDARRRREDLRLKGLVPPAVGPADGHRPRVRVHRRNPAGRRRLVYLLLRYDPDAPCDWPPLRVAGAGMLAGVAVVVPGATLLPIWLVPAAGLITAAAVIRFLFGWLHECYADRLLRQLPDTIALIVGAVRAGLPVAEAFRTVAREMPNPTGEQFGRVVAELSVGQRPETALLNLSQRTRVAEYAILSVTLAVQTKTGGRLAETLQTLGDMMRQRIALVGRAKALAGEAKLSAQVLASLPFVSVVAMSLERPGYLDPLFHDPRGQIMLAGGIVSLLLGILTMRHMIRKGTTI